MHEPPVHVGNAYIQELIAQMPDPAAREMATSLLIGSGPLSDEIARWAAWYICRQLDPCHRDSRMRHVQMELAIDPARTDREIARQCGVSPSTVGKYRRQLAQPAAS